MSLKKADRPALILVDIQKAFEDEQYWGGSRSTPQAEENAKTLLEYWRVNELPFFHIKHCSTNLDAKLGVNSPGNEFKDGFAPQAGETIIKKSVNSAFIGTDLKEIFVRKRINTVVIVGLTTDHCVSTTTRMAGNYGFDTYVVADATATFGRKGINGEEYDGETMHLTALAQLSGEFATVINSKELLVLLERSIRSL